MRTVMICLVMMLMTTVASADVTFLFGDQYNEIVFEALDIGPVHLGGTLAVDYTTIQSEPTQNFQLDIKDNFFGPYISLDLAKGPVKPYVAYKPMIANSRTDKWFHVFGAGVSVEVNDSFGLVAEYQYCEQRKDDDKLVLGVSWMW